MEMKRFKYILCVILMFAPLVMSALTPTEVFEKAKSKIKGASTISASFKMAVGGRSCNGTLMSKGSKFCLTSNLTSSWYDGKSLWVYNPSSAETTVVKPDASELQEANPLLYISAASNFKVMSSKQKKAGNETVVLVPTKNGTGVKSVMLFINSSTYLPTSIEITPTSGSKVTLTLSNIKLNTSISDSKFTYPKSSYPKAKVVDLR